MENFNDITWFGHASFMFVDSKTGQKIYYVDPFQLPSQDLDKADIVFVTHAHHDHLSEGDINHILKEDTVVVATSDSLETLSISAKKYPVEPNRQYDVRGFNFETVPAYNTNPQKLNFHPKSNNWVGYIFEINGKKIYHAGDTDFIPEMRDLASKNLDIAMLPMGGTYTMDVEEMIEAANAISAKYTIPMHYKRLLGEKAKEAEEKLKSGVKNSQVLILEEVS
ncbi:MAG: MBL fold metallo-hydrolase [Candidatus Levyibacteriota bacterium]